MRRTRCLSFNVALNAKTDIANANQTGSCQPVADISMDHAQFLFWPCTTWGKAIHARAIGISPCWVV